MQKLKFKNPPLIELIAELRWLPPGMVPGGPQQVSQPFFSTGYSDQLYMRFASLIGVKDFLHSERLVPPNFPSIPGQSVYRYTERGLHPGRPVFQLGPGVFTANITPPYSSWDDFRPFVEIGVNALLDARDGPEKEIEFISASVRYLDSFTAIHTRGMSVEKFLREILGIEVRLPASIRDQLESGKEVTPSLQVMVPLPGMRRMDIAIAEGLSPAGPGIIMNTAAGSLQPIAPNLRAVMEFLDGAHDVISNMFVGMTQKIHSLMEPKQ